MPKDRVRPRTEVQSEQPERLVCESKRTKANDAADNASYWIALPYVGTLMCDLCTCHHQTGARAKYHTVISTSVPVWSDW
jgi:hypothetical protein